MTDPSFLYRRILLKLSGEAMGSSEGGGLDSEAIQQIATSINDCHLRGLEIGIVVGGGNIWRGVQGEALGMKRSPADQVGMIATVINGITLSQALQQLGCPTRVLSAFPVGNFVETYSWQTALSSLEKGEVVLFVGGTGHPHFTTDSTAALRASEIEADVLLKATKVDGIYESDPVKNREAKKHDLMSYSDVLTQELKALDAAAVVICRDSEIPIRVFNFRTHSLLEAVSNANCGTLVS